MRINGTTANFMKTRKRGDLVLLLCAASKQGTAGTNTTYSYFTSSRLNQGGDKGIPELKETINRGKVLETDSKYVKLAKTGGRKNLLCYRENVRKNTGPKYYKVPEWYYHDDGKGKEDQELSEEEKHKRYKVTYGKRSYKTLEKSKVYERPDYMTHLEPDELRISLGESGRIPDRPIFGYDSFSFWKRDELEKSDKLPTLVKKDETEERLRVVLRGAGGPG
ncbi:hypothetical protein OS493_011581 [Desmophyllum pertusum]|uniref:Uncharacterized protein n=1 Tax=Desmophyllum pertusum TaxID=174260 RepID=A0A9W9YQU2_9CNID|nr:hypothetical protein OS493_011581 [Desmophyllum pertusum]